MVYALRGGQEGGLSIAHNIIGSKEKDLKTVERRGRKDEAEDSENRSLYFTQRLPLNVVVLLLFKDQITRRFCVLCVVLAFSALIFSCFPLIARNPPTLNDNGLSITVTH